MRRFFGALLTAVLLTAVLLTAVLPGSALALGEEEADAAARAAAREAVAVCVTEDMTDLETLTALHDWLALHCDYGATLRGETAYGALAEGAAVCTGYAAGYALLAAEAGLEGTDTYSRELDHAWILATLEGTRYFSDCTWDDGKNQKLGLIRHAYFLFDEKNARDTGHYGWDSAESVPGGALEAAPWLAAVTRVIFSGEYAYYIDGDFRLWRCRRETWDTELLWEGSDRWPREPDRAEELYTGLILVRDRLYFNTPRAVCYYDLRLDRVRTARTPDTADGLLYGVGERDGTLVVSRAESASALTWDTIDTGISLRGAWGY